MKRPMGQAPRILGLKPRLAITCASVNPPSGQAVTFALLTDNNWSVRHAIESSARRCSKFALVVQSVYSVYTIYLINIMQMIHSNT